MMGFLRRLFGLGPNQLEQDTPDTRSVLYVEPYLAKPDKGTGLRSRVRLVTPDGKVLMNRAGPNANAGAMVMLARLIADSRIKLRIPDDNDNDG